MKDCIGEDFILSKEILCPGGAHIPAKSVGRLVEIIDDARVVLFFEGRGRVNISRSSIRARAFKVGDRVRIVGEDKFNTEGVIEHIWTSASSVYMYRILSKVGHKSYESHALRLVPETVGVPMVISELAKHMIAAGTGCNHRSVPEWFQPIVNTLSAMPKLSQMDPAQLEFIIKKFMEYRRVDCRSDLVANVLFGIQSSASSQQLRNLERSLHGYKEKLDIEWKKLDKIIPIEFQYAALKAYAETQNV